MLSKMLELSGANGPGLPAILFPAVACSCLVPRQAAGSIGARGGKVCWHDLDIRAIGGS